MKRFFVRMLVATSIAAGTFAVASPASAAVTMEMTGLPKLDVQSAAWSVAMPLTQSIGGANRANGRSTFQDVTITRRADMNTPSLAVRCAGGENIKEVKLHYLDGATEYQTVTLGDVLITAVSQKEGPSRNEGTETVSLNFRTIKWSSSTGKGANEQGWSLDQNKKAQVDAPTSPSPAAPPDDKRSKEPAVAAKVAPLLLPTKTHASKVASR